MLEERNIPYRYREYTEEPLDEQELRDLFAMLRMAPRELLRRRDAANRELGLTGDEPDETLVAAMAAHPTLLQRPLGIAAGRAVVGRPPERLLDLVPSDA